MAAVDMSHERRLSDMRPLASQEPSQEESFQPGLEAPLRVHDVDFFDGREGYKENFINGFPIKYPTAVDPLADDVLSLPAGGGRLDYQHFSVVMSKSRRLAMFVAVNISGKELFDIPRGRDKWFLDERAGLENQHGEALYSSNDLDRGHLVRRMDPNWGDRSTAHRANFDTFHFTNCAPQMAGMNQRAWLSLERYILNGAGAADERISVFTGPVFSDRDIEYRGALIPLAYWKVVAFVSDDRKPSATAYMVDQEDELDGLEVAFGRFRTYQRSIRYIEERANLDFGELKKFDGLSNEEAATGKQVERVLEGADDIRV